ncbi:ABC transporter permease [Hymenobacter persicinus]|uniref:ABC transporter permease n=1 Tax=Hymenobacter persicinus TaxID=2025506 RepID=A0A4Q5L7M9_9BACT|nr:ABC transporter permease [Hymenobacter persicinus]RYU76420.1 ABC transporter permease [Hymenobacter persicinus]
MGRFLLHRLLRLLPATWAILSIIFLLSRSFSQQQLATGRLADVSSTAHSASGAQRELAERQLRARLGLAEPLFYFSAAPRATAGLAARWQWNGTTNQYHRWLRQLSRAELGFSFRDEQPVTALLQRSLGYTLPLTAGAAACTIGLAWLAAPYLGWPRRRRSALLSALYLLDALPLFVVALLLLLLLANPDMLAWFPAYGLGREDPAASGLAQLQFRLYYLALPILALTLVSLPALIVQLDAALRQELRADYVVTARAKGLPEALVMRRHALRNALLPALTLLTELLPGLVAGSVVVELVYSLPGMGRRLAEAAAAHDYPVLLGGVLLIALVRLVAQVLADVLYFLTDPRIRLSQ